MKHIDSVYGDDVLAAAILSEEPYISIVDPIAWDLCKDRLPYPPALVIEPQSLERDALDALARALPLQTRLVGVGGGLVIDATKYLALRESEYLTPVLVPSISSSSAPFSDAITVRKDGVPVGMVRPGMPKRIIVDYKLISAASPRLNRAGYADLLAQSTALADWRLGAELGVLEMDQHIFDRMQALMEKAFDIAADVATGSQDGILTLMRLFEKSSALAAEKPSLPAGAGSEHLLAWHLEGTTGRHFIHGEIVALGIVVTDYLQSGNRSRLRDALDLAHVVYRLSDLEITWEQLADALLSVSDYNQSVRHYCSIFDRTTWTPAMLEEVRRRVS